MTVHETLKIISLAPTHAADIVLETMQDTTDGQIRRDVQYLNALGLIEPTGDTVKPAKHGRPAKVWRITTMGERVLSGLT